MADQGQPGAGEGDSQLATKTGSLDKLLIPQEVWMIFSGGERGIRSFRYFVPAGDSSESKTQFDEFSFAFSELLYSNPIFSCYFALEILTS